MVVGLNLSWQGFKRKAVYTEGGGPVCKCTGKCTLEEGVQGGDGDLGVQKFFNWFLKLTNQKRPKVGLPYVPLFQALSCFFHRKSRFLLQSIKIV